MREIRYACALGFACSFLCTSGISGDTLTSASYRLRAGTPTAAGGIDHASTAGNPSVGALFGVAGQSSTVGKSQAPVSGTTLEGGFYPATRFAPEPAGPASLVAGALVLLGLRSRRTRR